MARIIEAEIKAAAIWAATTAEETVAIGITTNRTMAAAISKITSVADSKENYYDQY